MSKSHKNQLFKRIIDLGKVTEADVDDLVRIWRVGTGDEKAITIADFVQTVNEDLGDEEEGLSLTELIEALEAVVRTKQNIPTGHIIGLQLSINALDNTKFDIAGGAYAINTFTDITDINVVVKEITSPIVGITPAYLATSPASYIAIDADENIIQSSSPFTNPDRRNLAILGAVIHTNNTVINVVNEIKAPIVTPTNQLHDFMKAVGALNLEGNIYGAGTTGMRITKSAGTIWGLGINAQDFGNPHQLDIPLQTDLTFRYRLRDSTEYADTLVINPDNWDNAGVLDTVPNNRFTVQRINLFQSGLTRIQYGQKIYDNFDEASVLAPNEPFETEKNIADNAIFRAYLIIKKGVTNLATAIASEDASFIPVDKFGNIVTGAGVIIDYDVIITALGYTPEDVANKATDFTVVNNTLYPTTQAVANYATPLTRTLTINGVTFDLSANRTWSVGTVTSVAMTVPTGLSIAGTPITTSGTLALTYTAGYAIPTTAKQTEWDTAYTNRITSLTTTGASGAATLISNVLNIPNYTLAGLGGIGGTIAAGQVAFGTGANTIGGSANLTYGAQFSVNSDTDFTSTLGRLRISSFVTGAFYLSTVNNASLSNYALLQNSGGSTTINAVSGQNINFNINNISVGGHIGATGFWRFGNITPTEKVDVDGRIRVRLIDNATGNFVTTSATGVLQQRTAAEVRTDIGGIGGTIASGQVAFGTGVNTIGGDSEFTFDSTNKRLLTREIRLTGVTPLIEFRDTDGTDFYQVNNGNVFYISHTNTSSVNSVIRLTTTSLAVGGNIAPTNTLDVNGSARIRTIANAVSTEVLVPSATGVINKRTLTEFKGDLGLTNGITGTGVAGQVAFFNGAGSVTGDSVFLYDSSTNELTIDRVNIYTTSLGSVFRNTGTDAFTNISGGNQTNVGANIVVYGSTHATNPNRLDFRYGSTTTWSILSSGIFQSNGAQTIQTSSGVLTLQPSGGASSGVNITDRINIYSGGITGVLRNTSTDGITVVAGGNTTADGGNIMMYGSTHATTPNLIQLRVGSTTELSIDSSIVDIPTNYLQARGGITNSALDNSPVSTGPILTYTLTNGGSGYVDGFYNNVVLTSVGNAAGALYDITVVGGIVTIATLVHQGNRYVVGGTYTIVNTLLGGTGSGLIITVNTVQGADIYLTRTGGTAIRFENTTTSITADAIYGSILFGGRDSTIFASGDNGAIIGKAISTNGGLYLDFETNAFTSANRTLSLRLRHDSARFLDGTAAIPALGFLNDINTGLYSAGADILGVSTAGVLRWSVLADGALQSNGAQTIQTSTGNLTLATAAGNGNIILTPNGTGSIIVNATSTLLTPKFAVNGTSVFGNLTNTGTTGTLRIAFVDNSAVYLQAGLNATSLSSMDLAISDIANGTTRARFRANGNLLLGTDTDSGDKLRVNGTVRIDSVTNATGNIVTISAAGVLQQRTLAEIVTDGGFVTLTGAQTITGVKTFDADVVFGNQSLDFISWADTLGLFSMFMTNQFTHKYRGGAAGALNMGQYDLNGNASINNTSNAKLGFGTNNTSRLEIEAAGDVLLKKVDNGTGNFVTIDATTGQLKQRTAAQVNTDIITEVNKASGITITDAGGGATYSWSLLFAIEQKIGTQKRLIISVSGLSSTGTPTGILEIDFDNSSVGNFTVGQVNRITSSNMTDIDKVVPIVFGTSIIRFANKDTPTTYKTAVTFSSSTLLLEVWY